MELLSPAHNCLEIRGTDGRIRRARDGVFTVPDAQARDFRAAGCGPRISAPVGGPVFVCATCGFRAVIRDRPCPRCAGVVQPE